MARLEKARTKETSAALPSLPHHREATHTYTHTHTPIRSYAAPQPHSRKTTPFGLASSSTSVHPSSFKPKPVARTVSSLSNLHLQSGTLCPEDQQQFQFQSQSAYISGTLPHTSSLSPSTNLIAGPAHHQQRKQHQRTQHYARGSMNRVEQGYHAQETMAAFSRTVDMASCKSPGSMATAAKATTVPDQRPSFVISQPMYTVPAATVVIESTTPPCESVANGAAAGGLIPLVGREYVNYSSLNGTLATGAAVVDAKPRPLSSMEFAESWLSTVSPSSSLTNAPSRGVVPCSSLSKDCPENNSSLCTIVPRDSEQTESATVTRISFDRQSIHPLDPGYSEGCFGEPTPLPKDTIFASSSPLDNGPCLPIQLQLHPHPHPHPHPQQQHLFLRKKTSFAAKLRKVFVSKQSMSKGTVQTQEAILSTTNNGLPMHGTSKSLLEQHRGSVSSASSSDTALGHVVVRRGSTQTVTPSTSPESSPLNSPMMKANPASGHSSSISPFSPLDAESTINIKVSGSVLPKNLNADLPPIPTRTHKKRLSFASISSFFGTRSLQERRAKQPRSSSVPHVENPLAIVGRQIAGFQRRHSLNELHESPKPEENQLSVHQLVSPSWEEGCIATSSQSTSTAGAPPQVPAKKLSLVRVFSKQKKKGSSAPVPLAPLPPKPLKSALVQRPTASSTTTKVHPVHNAVTRRRSASVRSQTSSHRRRHSVHRHQQQSRQSSRQRPNSDDPFARLAEANQALASLSRQDSRNESNDYGVVALDDDDFCTSTLSYEDLGPVYLDQIHPHDPQSPTRPATKEITPPKPRVLPVTTRENSSSAKAPQFGSSPCNSPKQNPLSTLTGSPSSSRFSYSSGSGETSFDAYHSRTSSVSDGSCASSACSIRFNDSVTTSSDRTSVTATPTGVFNALLPASAARISVDRIAMESLMARQGQMHGAEYYEHPMAHSIHPMAVTGYPKQGQWPQQQPSVADPPYLADDYNLEIQYHYPHECYNVDPRRQRRLQFSIEEPIIHHTWTPDQYDRTSDPNITASRLTPAIAHKIKLELNHFKSQEMEIHQESRKYTHYFI